MYATLAYFQRLPLNVLSKSRQRCSYRGSDFFITKDLKFLPHFACPTFIQGPMFILFAKSSRPYAYSLPYVYYGL